MTAVLSRRAAPPSTPTSVSERDRWRMRHVAVCALLGALAFNSSAGYVAADTKLDLVVNPVGFLQRALHLWDPLGFSGQVQNQAYGYLFPIGPFFLAGHAIGLPGWVVQRLWWSLLLITAYAGMVVLARRIGIGSPATRMLGAVAYAASPHLLSVLGPVSAEALPMCLAPWVVAPLIGGDRPVTARRAAMCSGVAVLLMGGANAGLDLAALVPALVYLLAGRRWKLLGWWVVAVVLACVWWIGPLLLLGRYSPPFLSYIESASTTTAHTSLVESLRGTSDWVAYLPSSGWRAGWTELTDAPVIVLSVVVCALGLAGLASRRCPQRTWLVLTLLVGVLAVTAGHRAGVEGLFAGPTHAALDGVLAPLRNVHKFDVVIRLPLALGLAHLVGSPSRAGNRMERLLRGRFAIAIAACAVVGTAAPLLGLSLAPDEPVAALPAYWQQAAGWLAAHPGRTLIIPPSHDETYVWGRVTDNPLQSLARQPWAERNSIPLVPAGNIRMLDAVSQRLASGEPSSGLAPFLESAGFQYLLVRNDLDQANADTIRPVLTRQALAGSPGLRLVASFGPLLGGNLGSTPVDQNLRRRLPAVQIWRIGPIADRRVSATPESDVLAVSGGPESLLNLDDAGVNARPAVLLGDRSDALRPGRFALTDGLRRREVDFGAVTANASATLTRTDPLRLDRPTSDYQPYPVRFETVGAYVGARAVLASSSGSDPFGAATAPAQQPYAAVDALRSTRWRSAPFTRAIGQWLQVVLTGPMNVSRIALRVPPGSPVSQVAVRTDRGVTRAAIDQPGQLQVIPVRAGPTKRVRATITGLRVGSAVYSQVGITDLRIPGVRIAKTLRVPDELPAGTSVDLVQFTAASDARTGCVDYDGRPLCAAHLTQADEEAAGLDRTFTLPGGGSYTLTATVVPRAGRPLDRIIERASGLHLRINATTTAVPDPRARPLAAVDGDLHTGWIARPRDANPTLRLSWRHPRTVRRLRLRVDPLLAATAPSSVLIRANGETRTAIVPPSGWVQFSPVRTNRLSMTLRADTLRASFDSRPGGTTVLGLGVSELTVPGVTTHPVLGSTRVVLPCGTLPTVRIDGSATPLTATTTVGALRSKQRIVAQPCRATAPLPAGTSRLVARTDVAWRVDSVTLHREPVAAAGPAPAVGVAVTRWSTVARTLRLAARSEPTLLTITENTNPGWQATFDGKPIPRQTVNGWQQGFVVPAGAAGTVYLTFAPDRTYRLLLLIGALAALLLIVAALFLDRGRRGPAAPAQPTRLARRWLVPLAGSVLVTLAGGVTGATTCAAALLAGWLLGRSARLRVVRAGLWMATAAGCYLIAGLSVALRPWPASAYPADANWNQALCLTALALTATAPLVRGGHRGRAGAAATPAPRRLGAAPQKRRASPPA